MTPPSITSWIQDRNSEVKDRDNNLSTQDHPGYPVWRAALEELGRQRNLSTPFTPGKSPGYVTALVACGADPEQIKAIHVLAFG
jgi:hypothetical protein